MAVLEFLAGGDTGVKPIGTARVLFPDGPALFVRWLKNCINICGEIDWALFGSAGKSGVGGSVGDPLLVGADWTISMGATVIGNGGGMFPMIIFDGPLAAAFIGVWLVELVVASGVATGSGSDIKRVGKRKGLAGGSGVT